MFSFCCCAFLLLFSNCFGQEYKEAYFDQKLDHFNFESYGNRTYKQRYLYNDTWWNGKGPIFFYAGNEGNIENFWKNTGFVFEIAPTFHALVVFAEHRYYGKSLPFGNDSFGPPNIGLLSVTQALADYAFFLKSFKQQFKAERCPIIAFGGSYGGQLAAYMRFKYPNIIHGAISSSAPIFMASGKVPAEVFFQAVTKDFRDVSLSCESQVRAGFAQLDAWAKDGPSGLAQISKTFRLCSALASADDYKHLLLWARNAFVMAAMMDYPYPATFMGNFPAKPVNVMCSKLLSAVSPAEGLRDASAVFYNSSETSTCFDIYKEYISCADATGCGLGSDSKAWDYQVCTEIGLEASTTGQLDMFPVLPYTPKMRDDYCLKTWKVLPRRSWLDTLFWGEDISSTSNIVFSNGNLDPWAPGGVLRNISETISAVLVDGGAHHLDLRGSNEKDPPSVITARKFHARKISEWLTQFYRQSRSYGM